MVSGCAWKLHEGVRSLRAPRSSLQQARHAEDMKSGCMAMGGIVARKAAKEGKAPKEQGDGRDAMVRRP